MRIVVGMLLLVGCGRVAFEPASSDATSTGDGILDDTSMPGPDADPCDVDDGQCFVECLAIDPECTTTCGDARCVGNAGETCACADCVTTTPVCGNGQCDPGEAPACVADCGPDPWPWESDAQMMFAMINATRTGGHRCPGAPAAVTGPAVTFDPIMVPGAREWAWEISHHRHFQAGGNGCNGRTYAQRQIDGKFSGNVRANLYANVAAALSGLLMNMQYCELLMTPGAVRGATAVAFDTDEAYVFVFD